MEHAAILAYECIIIITDEINTIDSYDFFIKLNV